MRIEDDVVADDRTVSIAQAELSLGEELGAIIGNQILAAPMEGADSFTGTGTDDDKTISFGFFGMMETPPVTGWLVCMTGSEKGKDFRLHTGKNFIGRATSMDVILVDDKKISRQKHCAVIYEPKENRFFVSPEGGNTTYLNDEMINKAENLKEGDIIRIGDTGLLFIPFCKGERTWEEE